MCRGCSDFSNSVCGGMFPTQIQYLVGEFYLSLETYFPGVIDEIIMLNLVFIPFSVTSDNESFHYNKTVQSKYRNNITNSIGNRIRSKFSVVTAVVHV